MGYIDVGFACSPRANGQAFPELSFINSSLDRRFVMNPSPDITMPAQPWGTCVRSAEGVATSGDALNLTSVPHTFSFDLPAGYAFGHDTDDDTFRDFLPNLDLNVRGATGAIFLDRQGGNHLWESERLLVTVVPPLAAPLPDSYMAEVCLLTRFEGNMFVDGDDVNYTPNTTCVTKTWVPKGDLDCDGDIDIHDVRQLGRFISRGQQLPPGEPCPDLGVKGGGQCFAGFPCPGDLDCNSRIDRQDFLRLLRYVKGNPFRQVPGCLAVGIVPPV
jgi:hypothetical protein